MGTVRVERCPKCNAMIGEGMQAVHEEMAHPTPAVAALRAKLPVHVGNGVDMRVTALDLDLKTAHSLAQLAAENREKAVKQQLADKLVTALVMKVDLRGVGTIGRIREVVEQTLAAFVFEEH